MKKSHITQYANVLKSLIQILHGNKNEISKSKIINKIATRKNLTSNFCLESPKGSNPHSYTDTFSASGLFIPNTYDAPGITQESTVLITTNTKIAEYSSIYWYLESNQI